MIKKLFIFLKKDTYCNHGCLDYENQGIMIIASKFLKKNKLGVHKDIDYTDLASTFIQAI